MYFFICCNCLKLSIPILFINDIDKIIFEKLEKKGLVFEKDGAKWFKSSEFFTENDVVIQRSKDEGHTYFFSDMAYHYDKFFIRKYHNVINIFGADHHSHVDRLKSALQALNIKTDKLKILLTQIVHFKNENEVQKFSKRSGNIYTVRDLVEIVGASDRANDRASDRAIDRLTNK